MEFEMQLPVPAPGDISLLQQVQQQWNSGNQTMAVQMLRPRAEQGEAWAAALSAWLLMQQGYPAIEESIPWAIAAARAGLPSQLTHTFNNVMAHLSSYPQLVERLPELFKLGLPLNIGVDLVGQGWAVASNGQHELGLQLMMLQAPVYPIVEPYLSAMVDHARVQVALLEEAAATARGHEEELAEATDHALMAITKATSDLETSAQQGNLLVSTVTSDATNSLFKADAERNERQSRGAWNWGLVVLGAAAVVAVLPVVLHYLNLGADYKAIEQIALHLVSTAALGTFAGVLLARGRSRDHAAQRAHDLSTAMGTMITYSNQISDPAERQRFMTTMGQVVLQAHLTSGSKQSGNEDSTANLLAIANLVKPSSLPAAAQSLS